MPISRPSLQKISSLSAAQHPPKNKMNTNIKLYIMNKTIRHLLTTALFCLLIYMSGFAQTAATYPPQYGKPFAGVPDRRDVTMYQVNMRAFSKDGKLSAVTERLDSIKALG